MNGIPEKVIQLLTQGNMVQVKEESTNQILKLTPLADTDQFKDMIEVRDSAGEITGAKTQAEVRESLENNEWILVS